MPTAKSFDGTPLHFEIIGDPQRPCIFLGPHFYASYRLTGIQELEDPTPSWIDGLKADFRLLLADYPRGIGQTPNALGLDYSPEIAVEEVCRIADAAGAGRFGWVGYSFGAALGVQLACRRPERVAALACGGFPPLNAPFERMLEITTDMAKNPLPGWPQDQENMLYQSVGFYRPLPSWPEREEVAKLQMPRMAFMGTEDRGDGLPEQYMTPLADPLRAAEPELLELGWEIAWLEGMNHLGAIAPSASLPLVRSFFRKALDTRSSQLSP